MKRFILLFVSVLFLSNGFAQKKVVKNIDREISLSTFKSHLYFLASDELRGRNTGTIENKIAARYIAEQYRANGIKMLPGMDTYFQDVTLIKEVTPQQATFTVGDQSFVLNEDLVFFSSTNGSFECEVIFAGFGLEEDLEGLDIDGKLVIAKSGNGEANKRITPFTIQKQKLIAERGGIGLIELYKPIQYPWKMIIYYFSGEKYKLDNQTSKKQNKFPSAWLKDEDGTLLSYFEQADGKIGKLEISGKNNLSVKVPNVLGLVEGTDPDLKNEYILISSHFDHIGVGTNSEDSIFNGARDNGIGVANMLTTGKYIAEHPLKRSVIFMACNAEEKGLLGSRWYADQPVVPLKQTIYNLNTDNGGYNDTGKVTIIGYGRTSVNSLLVKSAEAFGMEAIDDPVPEQNLFDRSDNVSFASKGVPGVSYGPGFTSMDEEIRKYYHQPADEPQTLDYNYLTKYTKAFAYALTLIGNYEGAITWVEGDKYEAAAKDLYDE